MSDEVVVTLRIRIGFGDVSIDIVGTHFVKVGTRRIGCWWRRRLSELRLLVWSGRRGRLGKNVGTVRKGCRIETWRSSCYARQKASRRRSSSRRGGYRRVAELPQWVCRSRWEPVSVQHGGQDGVFQVCVFGSKLVGECGRIVKVDFVEIERRWSCCRVSECVAGCSIRQSPTCSRRYVLLI